MAGLKERIGIRIKQARLEADMTQEELAEAVEITPNYISMLERGRKNPSIQILKKIADVLGVSISFLTDSEEDEKMKALSPKKIKLIKHIYELEPDKVEVLLKLAETLGKYKHK
ncbi:MAG: helix-turn-helix transcriptional regulator [Firmicutes bacterium]|nr:helix-turn-helix transcriptional regulator [Bacillota bacterium]